MNDPMMNNLPPQAIEIEESILARIIIEPKSANDVLNLLAPDDFYKTAHRKIFQAICDLGSAPIDVNTIVARLRNNKELEGAGGAAYLASLLDCPVATDVEYYCNIIREKSALRKMIERANAVINNCFASNDAAETIANAQEALAGIEISANIGGCESCHEILPRVVNNIEERTKNPGGISGITTGFRLIDKLLSGLQRTDLIILAARPSMGKTALAMQIARNAAYDGIPVIFESLEMSREQLLNRMISTEARVDSQNMRSGSVSSPEWDRILSAAGIIDSLPIVIDDKGLSNIGELRRRTKKRVEKYGSGLLIVDYVQLMLSKADNRFGELTVISRGLKTLAKELNIAVLALAQLNRKLEDRSNKRPQLADLKESGALEQDADVVAMIYRDEVYNADSKDSGKAEIIIAKHRNGAVGMVPLAYIPQFTRFENLARDNYDPNHK